MSLYRPAALIAAILSLPACSNAAPAPLPMQDDKPVELRRQFQDEMRKLEERQQAERRQLEERFRGQAERSRPPQPPPPPRMDRPQDGPEDLHRAVDRLQAELRNLRRDIEQLQGQLKGRDVPRKGEMPQFGRMFQQFAPLLKGLKVQPKPGGKFEFRMQPPGGKGFEFKQEFKPQDLRKMMEQFRHFMPQQGRQPDRRHHEDDDDDDDGDDDEDGAFGPPQFRRHVEKFFKEFERPGKKEKDY